MCLLLLLVTMTTNAAKGQKASALSSQVDQNTVVRFFYQPEGKYFHPPLVFRVVENNSPLVNTAPMREEGRTAYLTLKEINNLVKNLSHSDLKWQDSQIAGSLGSYKKLALAGVGLDAMEVLVISQDGTAKAQIPPTAICRALKPLDSALSTRRALWEFQGFRLNYGCKIPGFKRGAYRDH